MTKTASENTVKQGDQGHYSILGFIYMPSHAKPLFNQAGEVHDDASLQETLESIASALTNQDCSLIAHEKIMLDSDINWGDEAPWAKNPAATIHLIIFTEDGGKFMLIPGSHYSQSVYKELLNKAFQQNPNAFGLPAEKIPAHAIAAKQGDILAIHPDMHLATINAKHHMPMLVYSFSSQPQGSI